MLLISLTPTHPVYVQCMGRIIQIRQQFSCLILELFDPHINDKAMALSRI